MNIHTSVYNFIYAYINTYVCIYVYTLMWPAAHNNYIRMPKYIRGLFMRV